VDKQRLLELAGITEATHIGRHVGWVVVYHQEGEWGESTVAWGPFDTEKDANDYGWKLHETGEVGNFLVTEVLRP
jgi:hypothetical protein